ncbi:MAG: hypothetical protein QM655_12130 [Nocardioidaceae bacterium]
MIAASKPRARRSLRAAALVPALVILTGAFPAMAAPPDAEFWEAGPANNSLLWYLLVLGGIPVLLFVGIWFLVSVPHIVKAQKQDVVAVRDDVE